MSVLDKKLFLSDLQRVLGDYVPANMASKVIADAGELLSAYELTALPPDGGGPGTDESKQLIRLYQDAKDIEGRSQKTTARYGYILTRLLEDTKVPFRKMTVYHLRQYMLAEKERGISMNTIKGYCWVYSGFFQWLRNEGIIEADPTVNIGTIKARPEEETPFSGEQIQLIKEACKTDMQLAIVHFLLSTGCRISEMCSVNRRDIDFRNLRLDVIGKGNKQRTVYIDDVTAMLLKRYLDKREDLDPCLFYSRNHRRITPDGVRQMLKAIEKRSYVPNIHPHRFRRTLATNLIDRGMGIQEVAAILGHSKIDTTMTYVQVNQRNAENNYRRYACM